MFCLELFWKTYIYIHILAQFNSQRYLYANIFKICLSFEQKSVYNVALSILLLFFIFRLFFFLFFLFYLFAFFPWCELSSHFHVYVSLEILISSYHLFSCQIVFRNDSNNSMLANLFLHLHVGA